MKIIKQKPIDKVKKQLKILLNLLNPIKIKERHLLLKRIEDSFQNLDLPGSFSTEKEEWRKMFVDMSNCIPPLKSLDNLLQGFAIERIELIKEAVTKDVFNAPVVICTQKDNYVYLKEFLPYYRSLGVKHFVFIDNNSTDMSFDYLKAQDDVTLFSAPYAFQGTKKAGWKLQALSYIGLNHWYLWLDSDEFITYPRMEEIKLPEYIKRLESKKIFNVGGFMLDMYPEYNLFDSTKSNENFYSDYRYFDPDNNYYIVKNGRLFGGMRKRCLGVNLRLDKTPLIYCKSGNIPRGNHATFPITEHPEENFGCILKHYKFLPSDKEKYKMIAKGDSGYLSVKSLQKYLDLDSISIKNKDSKEFQDSKSLSFFPYIKDLVEEKPF